MKTILIVISLALITGCVGGPTKDFYHPRGPIGEKSPKEIPLYYSNDMRSDVQKHLKAGWRVIGSSDYHGQYPKEVEMTKQGRKVGAEKILYITKNPQTVSGVNHIVIPGIPQTITSQTYGGGYLNGYSTQTYTTIPGQPMQLEQPYSFTSYDVVVVFLTTEPPSK